MVYDLLLLLFIKMWYDLFIFITRILLTKMLLLVVIEEQYVPILTKTFLYYFYRCYFALHMARRTIKLSQVFVNRYILFERIDDIFCNSIILKGIVPVLFFTLPIINLNRYNEHHMHIICDFNDVVLIKTIICKTNIISFLPQV